MELVSGTETRSVFVGMDTKRRVGHSLRTARQQAGLTQAQTAAAAGVRRESLSLIENGQRSAHLETVNAVLGVLGYQIAFVPRPTDTQPAHHSPPDKAGTDPGTDPADGQQRRRWWRPKRRHPSL